MGLLDNVLGQGAAGSAGKTALKTAAVLGAIELIRRNGGLHGLREKMQNGGLGNVFGSWVGRGQNEPVQPGALGGVLGGALGAGGLGGLLSQLASRMGVSEEEASHHLAQALPEVVDRATPDGEIRGTGEIPDDIAHELSSLTRG